MTHPLTIKTVYVEGDDDLRILRAWFPGIQFTKAGIGRVPAELHELAACWNSAF